MAAVVKFPMVCPSCDAVSAMPYSAAMTANGGTNVALRCCACAYEWRFEIHDYTIGVVAKSDRREVADDDWDDYVAI